LHPLPHRKARLLQPIAAQAQKRDLGWWWPAAIELVVVATAGDTEKARSGRDGSLSNHGRFPSRCFEFATFEMAAGCSKPLEDGGHIPPFREYCISRTPDHKQRSRNLNVAKSMGTKKPLVFRVRRPLRERCFEHLRSTLAGLGSKGQHMTPNNTLVPTRKGEAPLLAAQRGRWAS